MPRTIETSQTTLIGRFLHLHCNLAPISAIRCDAAPPPNAAKGAAEAAPFVINPKKS